MRSRLSLQVIYGQNLLRCGQDTLITFSNRLYLRQFQQFKIELKFKITLRLSWQDTISNPLKLIDT